ncbi:MAG: hypothetical protein OJF60_002189 [Burkholderiaceae bacterium]|jgi:hypothetical protein|nr:MAG: hypothetical protein OJF60_002189 [Burkholderiaceae bacterium]
MSTPQEIFIEIDNLARALPAEAVPFAAALIGVDDGLHPVAQAFVRHCLVGRCPADAPPSIEARHDAIASLHVLMGIEGDAAEAQRQACYRTLAPYATAAREASEFRDAVHATLRVGASQYRPPSMH